MGHRDLGKGASAPSQQSPSPGALEGSSQRGRCTKGMQGLGQSTTRRGDGSVLHSSPNEKGSVGANIEIQRNISVRRISSSQERILIHPVMPRWLTIHEFLKPKNQAESSKLICVRGRKVLLRKAIYPGACSGKLSSRWQDWSEPVWGVGRWCHHTVDHPVGTMISGGIKGPQAWAGMVLPAARGVSQVHAGTEATDLSQAGAAQDEN